MSYSIDNSSQILAKTVWPVARAPKDTVSITENLWNGVFFILFLSTAASRKDLSKWALCPTKIALEHSYLFFVLLIILNKSFLTTGWFEKLKKKDKKAWKKLCRTVREDGPYVEAGENDNLIIQKLNANKDSFGIFGFSFLDQNKDKVKGAVIDGVEPTFDAIASGDYKVSRSLYFYVKKDHVGVIPGVQEYMEFFMSDDAVGEDGYLLDKGLIPLPASTRTKFQSDAKTLANLVR